MLSIHMERTNERTNDIRYDKKFRITLLALVIFLWRFSRFAPFHHPTVSTSVHEHGAHSPDQNLHVFSNSAAPSCGIFNRTCVLFVCSFSFYFVGTAYCSLPFTIRMDVCVCVCAI